MRSPSSRWAQANAIATRRAVILVIAGVIGAAAGILTYLAYHSIPQALLTMGAAIGGATGLLNQLIGADHGGPTNPGPTDQNGHS